MLSLAKFNSMVSLVAFFPFKSAQSALENINAISEGKLSFLKFIEMYLLIQTSCKHILPSGIVFTALSCGDVFKSVNPLKDCDDSLMSNLNI